LEANGTSLRTKLTILNAPLHPELPPNPILPSIAVTDLIAQRDLSDEQNKKKNALQDLKSEVRRVIATLLQEYEQLFGEKTSDTLAFGRDERKKKLIFRLNTQGYYHDFKEKLKKRIVPIIREKFLRPEEPQNKVSDPKEYFGELFSYLMSEINIILHDTFYKQQGLDTETIPDASVNEIKSFAEKLRIKALECEVNGTIEKSEWIHLDRIAYIEERAPLTLDLLVSSWYEHALFCLRQGDLDKAGASLHQCLALDPDALLPLFAYGALLCEIQDFSQADTIIKKLVHLAFFKSPNHSFVIRCHGLLAFYYSTCGIDTTGNMALFELLQAKTLLEKLPEYGTVTCAASVWIFLAQTTHELKLDTLTQKILEFANTSIQPRDMIYEELRIQQRVIQAELISFQGRIDESIQLLKEALELDHTHTNVWFAKGKIHMFLENKIESALECFQQALINRNLLSEQSRMSLFMHLGLVFLQSSHYGAAREIFLQSCQEFPVASSWLGVGVASFREEALDLAEMALAEANILDNTNPEVWGYLALLSLNGKPVMLFFCLYALMFNHI
jgi:tetratricopeptide (TPR) repeat protein